jgi:hypothetical protein
MLATSLRNTRRPGDEVNVQSGVEQAGRLFGDLHRQARAYLSSNSDIEEPTAGDLWEQASPDLEKALAIYDKKESADTPASTWIPRNRVPLYREIQDFLGAYSFSLQDLAQQIAKIQSRFAESQDQAREAHSNAIERVESVRTGFRLDQGFQYRS